MSLIGPGNNAERVMFVYWGRRGGLTQFTLELAKEAVARPGLNATISISRQNEVFEDFAQFGDHLFPGAAEFEQLQEMIVKARAESG